jgi:hypothetical protein
VRAARRSCWKGDRFEKAVVLRAWRTMVVEVGEAGEDKNEWEFVEEMVVEELEEEEEEEKEEERARRR